MQDGPSPRPGKALPDARVGLRAPAQGREGRLQFAAGASLGLGQPCAEEGPLHPAQGLGCRHGHIGLHAHVLPVGPRHGIDGPRRGDEGQELPAGKGGADVRTYTGPP